MDPPPITSTRNPRVVRARRYLERPRECRKDRVLVADGIHLVREAAATGLPCRALFFESPGRDREVRELADTARSLGWPRIPVRAHVLRAISPVESPQGILGFFERPRAAAWESLAPGGASAPLAVLHRLQDPANAGSILRSALASGVRAVVTTRGTVDPYHHRALRASMGAAFRLPMILEESAGPLPEKLRREGWQPVGLSPRAERSLADLEPGAPLALFLGAEGRGLDPAMERSLDFCLRIPHRPEAESLGVAAAAAVAFYQLTYFSRRSFPAGSENGA